MCLGGVVDGVDVVDVDVVAWCIVGMVVVVAAVGVGVDVVVAAVVVVGVVFVVVAVVVVAVVVFVGVGVVVAVFGDYDADDGTVDCEVVCLILFLFRMWWCC